MTAATTSFIDETIEAATGKVHLLRGGTGDPLVVLHHDIGNFGWLPLYDRLAGRFSVYVPDLPGFGASDRPDWARHPRDLAIMIHLLLDELGVDQAVFLGLGFGGWIAAEMATMNQRRVRRLVLVGAAGIQPREGEILDQIMISHQAYARAGFHADAPYEAQFGAEVPPETNSAWDFNRVMTSRVSWKPYMFSHQLPPLLPGVKTPTLLVWGEHDEVVPRICGQQYAEALPNARLVVVPESGHFVDMEQPDKLAELIEEQARGA